MFQVLGGNVDPSRFILCVIQDWSIQRDIDRNLTTLKGLVAKAILSPFCGVIERQDCKEVRGSL